jgi:hypothetical protein
MIRPMTPMLQRLDGEKTITRKERRPDLDPASV